MSHEHQLEKLRHRVRYLEILHKEAKLKAERLALQVAYYERVYKSVAQKEACND